MRKKIFACILALALSATPMSVFAEDISATQESITTEAQNDASDAAALENAQVTQTEVINTQDNEDLNTASFTGWTYGADGELRYFVNDQMVTNQFVCDGTYTYYLQSDGSPMKNRLTYHPDGEHLIYLDEYGHELFDTFKYCTDVGYTCYFNTFGYAYFDQVTFVNDVPYYLNACGKMEQSGWFQFANGVDYGCANSDGTLMYNTFSQDPYGRTVFYFWNGMAARGLITDGVWYYQMDETDGHLVGQFKKTFNYFAIGNSLTTHPIVAGTWWGNWGMAATTADNDYYHKLCASLEQNYSVNGNCIYYTSWETAGDRSSQLSILDSYLYSDLDLVTIQLGDNITGGFDSLTSDYEALVQYVRTKAPNAQIIIVDEFCWPIATIQAAQQTVCNEFNLAYVDLSAIRNDAYRAGAATVYGADGATHAITNGAVGSHPNDAGMAYIADQIYSKITVVPD